MFVYVSAVKQRQDRIEDGGKDKEKKRKREYKVYYT